MSCRSSSETVLRVLSTSKGSFKGSSKGSFKSLGFQGSFLSTYTVECSVSKLEVTTIIRLKYPA